MKKSILLFCATIILLVVNILYGLSTLPPDKEGGGIVNGNIIKIGEAMFNLEVADTDEERIRGLSGRESLPYNSVLLFEFEKEGKYGIWMKDMNFPIDIVWLDKDKKIIHKEEKVSPQTFPKSFYPTTNSLYVIELNSGTLEDKKIKIGDFAEF